LKVKISTVKSFGHTKYNINYHIIWIPKYRKPLLEHDKVKYVLEQIIRGQADNYKWEVLALEIQPDHLHLFLSARPEWNVAKIVKILKGNTSRQLRLVFPYLKETVKRHLWATGYYVGTAGHITQEAVVRYILEQQKQLRLQEVEKMDKETKKQLDTTILQFLPSLKRRVSLETIL
jgi:putative transposase